MKQIKWMQERATGEESIQRRQNVLMFFFLLIFCSCVHKHTILIKTKAIDSAAWALDIHFNGCHATRHQIKTWECNTSTHFTHNLLAWAEKAAAQNQIKFAYQSPDTRLVFQLVIMDEVFAVSEFNVQVRVCVRKHLISLKQNTEISKWESCVRATTC